jgi:hypothetical protein
MSTDREPRAQWTLDVTVFHGPEFGHQVKAAILSNRGNWMRCGTWTWSGLGIPAEVVTDIQSRVAAIISEHLVTRYGVQGQLPMTWAGDPEPF